MCKTHTDCGLRVAIGCILKAVTGEHVCLFGMKCSSWSIVNRGTSMRSPCTPSGFDTYASVKCANTLASRTAVPNGFPPTSLFVGKKPCTPEGPYASSYFAASAVEPSSWSSPTNQPYNGFAVSGICSVMYRCPVRNYLLKFCLPTLKS